MSSVAPVLASSGRINSDYRTSVLPGQSGTARLVQTAAPNAEANKKKDAAPVTGNQPAVQNSSATKQTTLPLTVLLSVNQPATSNGQATMDYQAMESDLRWGNLTAAQEVYIRLQSDLLLSREPVSLPKDGPATETTAASQKPPHASGELNTTA